MRSESPLEAAERRPVLDDAPEACVESSSAIFEARIRGKIGPALTREATSQAVRA